MILASILSFFGCKEKSESEMDLLIEKNVEEFNNRKIYKKLTALSTTNRDGRPPILFHI